MSESIPGQGQDLQVREAAERVRINHLNVVRCQIQILQRVQTPKGLSIDRGDIVEFEAEGFQFVQSLEVSRADVVDSVVVEDESSGVGGERDRTVDGVRVDCARAVDD